MLTKGAVFIDGEPLGDFVGEISVQELPEGLNKQLQAFPELSLSAEVSPGAYLALRRLVFYGYRQGTYRRMKRWIKNRKGGNEC